jgi:hypothetical protein
VASRRYVLAGIGSGARLGSKLGYPRPELKLAKMAKVIKVMTLWETRGMRVFAA